MPATWPSQRARAENVPLVLGSATPSLESWQRATTGEYRLVSLPKRDPRSAAAGRRRRSTCGPKPRTRMARGAISRPLHHGHGRGPGGRRAGDPAAQPPRLQHAHSVPGLRARASAARAATWRSRTTGRARSRCATTATIRCPAPRAAPTCTFDGHPLQRPGHAAAGGRGAGPLPALSLPADGQRHDAAARQSRSRPGRLPRGDVRILLGTQMIAKGLDFPNVTLVGVINADTALHLPDFRAAERTFQLVAQVAGRTGRGEQGGRVLVQTLSPDHAAIRYAVRARLRRLCPARAADPAVAGLSAVRQANPYRRARRGREPGASAGGRDR